MLCYYIEQFIDIFSIIGNFRHFMLTSELILGFHPIIERTLFDAMHDWFSEHLGIISFIKIV